MFSMSLANTQQSWEQSVGEDEVSSRMGMSESSVLLSTPGGPHGSFPKTHTEEPERSVIMTFEIFIGIWITPKSYLEGWIGIFSSLHQTFPVELQGSQQADRFQHFCDVHFQTALKLDEQPADLRVDFPILWSERRMMKANTTKWSRGVRWTLESTGNFEETNTGMV